MTPLELFLARLDALDVQCVGAGDAVRSEGVNLNLFRRTGEEFLRRLGDARDKIATQRSRVTKGQLNDGSWVVLNDCARECEYLFGECLAFLQAARSRGHDIDADLCEIADALLDELSVGTVQWRRFTVPAVDESFRDFVQIIRLRFPASGVWDLPVAAHEFGHFVAGRLNVARANGTHALAFQDFKSDFFVQDPPPGEEWRFYLEEYFADVFATYALGPAYAFTCLFLRFEPASAHAENDRQHPSYAKRAHAILQTLKRMNMEKDSAGHFKTALTVLEGSWNEALASAGQATAIAPESQARIDGLVAQFYDMLKSGAPAVRFNRWQTAYAHCGWLKNNPPAEPKAGDFLISDLLGTAWICRLETGADLGKLSRRMTALCRLRTAVH